MPGSRLFTLALTALFALPACAAGGNSPAGGGAGAAGTGASGTGAAGGEGGGGPLFDAGKSDAPANGCQYVDLLFVIDNSPSMGPYQEDLAAAFPGFVDAMYEKLPPNVDLHVGITTTSFYDGNCSESVINCVSAASTQQIDDHYVKPQDGSTGQNGEQGRLFSFGGKAFFAANTSDPDPGPLKAWFAGAAVAAGESGCSFEMASAGAGYALHPANAAANAGFLRDEGAVLGIFVLSDEPDKSPEGVAAYKGMITSAKTKCGGEACVLLAGLIDPCIEGVNNTLWQFLNAFDKPPILGDIDDAAGYTAVIGDALAQVVKQTCDDIAVPK